MKASKRCEMYHTILLENYQDELAIVSEYHIREVAYMLAGAICSAEHEYDFYAADTDILEVASEAANMLTKQFDNNPVCRQMPLVLTAIQNYREFAIPQLGGLQTLSHLVVQQSCKANSLPAHRDKAAEAEISCDALQSNSKSKNIVLSMRNFVNSLISLWSKK